MRDYSFLKEYALWQNWTKVSDKALIGKIYFALFAVNRDKKAEIQVFYNATVAKQGLSKKELKMAKEKGLEETWEKLSKHLKNKRIPNFDKFMTIAPIPCIPKKFKDRLEWFYKEK